MNLCRWCNQRVMFGRVARTFRRSFSTASSAGSVGSRLAYDRIERFGASQPPVCTLVFQHALLSARDQWSGFVRHLRSTLASSSISVDAWFVDARNHGSSPHHPTHMIEDLVSDSRGFFAHHNLISTPQARRLPLVVIGVCAYTGPLAN